VIHDATALTEGEVVVGQADPYPSSIQVPEGLAAGGFPAGSRILAMDVFLADFRHTNPDDLDVLLVGPHGQSTILMSDAGGTHAADGLTLRFTDNRKVSLKLPNEDQLFTQPDGYLPANYRPSDTFPDPDNPGGALSVQHKAGLSVFEGTDPIGTWRLYVVDDKPLDVGTIRGFSLFIAVVAPPPTVP
jgi:hypothetical protein